MDKTHARIVADQRAKMRAIADVLDDTFNGPATPGTKRERQVAFVLLTAKFADYDDGRVNYISNGERADIITMMKELIARFEGRVGETDTKQ